MVEDVGTVAEPEIHSSFVATDVCTATAAVVLPHAANKATRATKHGAQRVSQLLPPHPVPAHTTFSMKARRESRLFSHSCCSSEVGGYLQQDSSNVISKQLAHT